MFFLDILELILGIENCLRIKGFCLVFRLLLWVQEGFAGIIRGCFGVLSKDNLLGLLGLVYRGLVRLLGSSVGDLMRCWKLSGYRRLAEVIKTLAGIFRTLAGVSRTCQGGNTTPTKVYKTIADM